MTLAALLNRPCTIVRRFDTGDVNDYGDVVRDEVALETVCELQQQQRGEPNDQGEFPESDWRIILPAGIEITTADVVIVDGVQYEMVGDPWEVRNPRIASVSHVEASLRQAGRIDPVESPGLYPSADLYPG